MANIYFGSEAIQQVEAAEGPLSPTEKRIVELEGYADAEYVDTKGIPTVGVGQTGEFSNVSFKDTVAKFEADTRSMIPNFDTLSPALQTELVQAAYRGDLQQSPEARNLINQGRFAEASQEFLNNDEYQTTDRAHIRDRMESVASTIANERRNTNTLTTGEAKQQELVNTSNNKTNDLAVRSEEKQLQVQGLTDREISIYKQGMSDYIRNGTEGTAATRAREFMDAQDKYNAAIHKQEQVKSDVIFQDLDSAAQFTGNTLLSTVNTIGRIAGGLLSLPSEIRAAYNLADATEEGFKQYQAILAKQAAGLDLNISEVQFVETDEFKSISQGMESMANAQDIQGGLGALGKYVNTEVTDEFVQEGADIFNGLASGDLTMGEFITESSSLLTSSPGAVGQATVESLPYILASAYNLPLTVASSWASNQNEAIETYRENNDGDIPTGKDLANLTMLAGGQSMVDHFGDRLVGGKNLTNLLSGVTGRKASSIAGDVVAGTAGEFVAEGGADVLGQLAGTAGKGEVDLATAYASGLLGAGAGGTTSGAIAGTALTAEAIDTAAEVTEGKGTKIKDAVSKVGQAAKAGKEAVASARKTTPEEETETTTTPAQEEPTTESADLNTRLSEAFAKADETPAQAQEIEADVRAEYETLKDAAREVVGRLQTGEGEITQQDKTIVENFQEAQQVIRARNKEVKARKAAQQAEQLASATKDTANTQTAVTNVLGSIELNPDSVTADQATAILANDKLNLNEEQRTKLEHHVEVAKTMSQVGKDIREGGKGFLGINQHLENAAAALEINNLDQVGSTLDTLRTFRDGHQVKVDTGIHNGKAMKPKLAKEVAKELDAMNAAIAKIENDLIYADVPTQDEQAEQGDTDVIIDDATTDVNRSDTTERTEGVAEQQVTEAVAEGDAVAEAEVNIDSRNLNTQLTEGVTEPTVRPETTNPKERTAFVRSLNWIKEFFKPNEKAKSILQKEADVFTDANLTKLVPTVNDYLGREISAEEQGVLRDYVKFRRQMEKLNSKILNTDNEFKNLDTMLYLADENGNLPENVKDAIYSNMYNWLATRSNETLFNDEDNIRAMLGLKDDQLTPTEAFQELGSAGVGRTTIAESIGNDILQSLGIVGDKSGSHHLDEHLANSLGMYAIKLMKDGKYITAKKKSKESLDALRGDIHVAGEMDMAQPIFIRVVSQKEGKRDVPTARVRQMTDLIKDANKTLEKGEEKLFEGLFNTTSGQKAPHFTQPTEVVTRVQGANRAVPKAVREILKKHQNRKHYFKHDTFNAFDALGKDNVLKMLGAKDPSTVHKVRREKQESINHSLERAYDNAMEFRDQVNSNGGMNTPFYFTHSMWRTGRFGIEQNLVNPQNNKVHRGLVTMEGWRQSLEMNDATEMSQFWAALDEPLGIDNREAFETNNDLVEAVELMEDYLINAEFTPAGAARLAELVASMPDGNMSFDAIVNLTRWKMADDLNEDTFEVDLGLEIDGKTNGVIIGMLQYGAANTSDELLAALGKGGFFGEGGPTNMEEFEKDGVDAYKEIANDWIKIIEGALDKATPEQAAAISASLEIFGIMDLTRDDNGIIIDKKTAKALRNLAKSPLMVTSYGSSADAVSATLATEFIEKMYDTIEDIARLENPTEKKVAGQTFLKQLNALAPGALRKGVSALEQDFSKEAITKIKDQILNIYGDSVDLVISTRYAKYLEGQKTVNNGQQLMYRRYYVLRQKMIDKALADGHADGSISRIEHISKETLANIEKQLAPVAPHLDNYWSKDSEGVGTSTDLLKFKKGRPPKGTKGAGAYSIEQKYADGTKQTLSSMVRTPINPGVSAGVISVHNQDGADIALTYESDMDTLGVHDANYWSIKDAAEGGKLQNSALLKIMKEMSIPEQAWKAFNRSYNTGTQLAQQVGMTEAELNKAMAELGPEVDAFPMKPAKVNQQIKDLKQLAVEAKQIKDEVLAKTRVIHQYADHNGLSTIEVNTTPVDTTATAAGKNAALGSVGIDAGIVFDGDVTTQTVDATSVQGVFDNLPNTGGKQENEAHTTYLRGLVHHMGNKIMTPFNLHMRTKEDAPNYGVMTDSDIYLTNLAEGATVTSSMLARGIPMSNQEVMAHELNHLVYLEGLQKDSQERRVVERMYLAAREQLDYTVFLNDPATASNAEIEGAKATFNHMFYEKSGQSLAEFAAFGTTNERMMLALENVSLKPSKVFQGSIGEIFRNILTTLVDMFSNRVLGLKGLSSDKKLVKLLDDMHQVSAKKRKGFINHAEDLALQVQNVTAVPVNLVASAVKKALTSKALLNNRFAFIAAPANVINNLDSRKATEVMREGFNAVSDEMIGTNTGFMTSVFREVIGRTKDNAAVRDLGRTANQKIDQERKQVKTAMTKNIQDSFHTEMSESDWTAVSKVFLKGDITKLLGMGSEAIQEILGSGRARNNLITQLEGQLVGNPNANFYLRQARNLGYYMNTGKSREKVALLNAHNIARVFGDKSVKVAEVTAVQVEPIIDTLATLHAINEANPEQVQQALDILARENAVDTVNNGITAVLMAHEGLKEQSKEQFSTLAEYKSLAIKGWTKEVYKEGVALETGTAAMHDNLIAQGYIKGAAIANDPTDPVQEQRWIYYAPDGALAPYMSTIVSLTNNVAKGSNRKEVNKRWGADNPAEASDVDILQINRSKMVAIKEMQARPNGPTGESAENYMIPIVNPKGEIVDWRYMMSEANKDGLMQKENHAAEILGSMAGNVVDKVNSAEVNKEAVAVLKDLYDKEYSKRKKAYVEIGPNSDNPRYREIWYQLPQAMRDEVNKIFGDSLSIRADLVTPMFGYRKFSLTELFSKDPESRKWYERLVTDMLTALFGEKASRYVRKSENIMQALTQEVKDVIIVKSGFVTISNMLSNTMLLVMNGMSPIKAFKYQYRAYINSSEMVKEVRKVRDLTNDLTNKALSPVQRRQREAEIARLRKRIEQNPTYEAYSAGLMPTIVDDASADTEFTNSTRGKAQRAVSEGIDKGLGFTPSWVREGVKSVVGLPDTELYRFMNNMVMQSDFIARYAILEHWKEESNGVATPEMIGEAEELFVNFDAPTHKGLQYLNDIGLAWFSKYVLRVNRSIARTFAKNPVSAVMAVLGVEASGLNVDDPTESAVFGGGNPFRVIGDPLSKAMDATDATLIGQAFS